MAMMHKTAWTLALCLCAGCGNEPVERWRDPPPGDYGAGPATLAVVATDYASSALSLVDLQTGQVRKRAVVHSGTRLPLGMTALSGDVVLGRGGPDSVVLVDRARAVVTQVAHDTGEVKEQFNVATGFYANPADATLLDGQWWVPRSARNPHAATTADTSDDGDDLLLVDATTRLPTSRLGLGELSTLPGGIAAPQRLVPTNGAVWLPLGSFAADFRSQGPGRLVRVSRPSPTLAGTVDLAPWKNCVSAEATSDELIVVCLGAFADGPAGQLAASAVLRVDLQPPHQVEVLQAASGLGDQPFGAALAVHKSVVYVQTMGAFDPKRPDRLWQMSLQPGQAAQPTVVQTEAFALGSVVVDHERNTLWVARRDQQGDLLRFTLHDGTLQALPPLAAMPDGLRANALAVP